MQLARTKPQPKLSETEDPRAWQGQNGYHPGYGGSGYDDPGVSGSTAGIYQDDPFPATEPGRQKRRWPIVSAVLVLLVLVIGGGLFGGWQYVQGQYYIGVQSGHVALFRGVDQDVAGISLSSVIQPYPSLQLSQLDSDSKAQVSQTISYGSLASAQSVVQHLQQQVTACQQGYQALASWQAQHIKYLQAVAAYNKLPNAQKKGARKPAAPPAEPASPPSASCAPSAAFGIPASALPSQSGTNPAASPSAAPKPQATTTPSPRKSA